MFWGSSSMKYEVFLVVDNPTIPIFIVFCNHSKTNIREKVNLAILKELSL